MLTWLHPTLSMSRLLLCCADGGMIARRFRSAITDLGDLAIMRHPTLSFMSQAYELRADVTPYDAAHIGLAEALDCDLVTAGARLAKAPGPRCQIRIVRF